MHRAYQSKIQAAKKLKTSLRIGAIRVKNYRGARCLRTAKAHLNFDKFNNVRVHRTNFWSYTNVKHGSARHVRASIKIRLNKYVLRPKLGYFDKPTSLSSYGYSFQRAQIIQT